MRSCKILQFKSKSKSKHMILLLKNSKKQYLIHVGISIICFILSWIIIAFMFTLMK